MSLGLRACQSIDYQGSLPGLINSGIKIVVVRDLQDLLLVPLGYI